MSSFQFTRYLYDKTEVMQSLTMCLLDADAKEDALFWAYELHHSGLTEELTNLFWTVYYDFFYILNPGFESYLLKKMSKKSATESGDKLVAEIVGNFMARPHTLDVFLIKQCHAHNIRPVGPLVDMCFDDSGNVGTGDIQYNKFLKTTKSTHKYQYQSEHIQTVLLARLLQQHTFVQQLPSSSSSSSSPSSTLICGKNHYVRVTAEEVISYETILASLPLLPAYKILSLARVCAIDAHGYLSLFASSKREISDMALAYRENWLYHAFCTPLWRQRIDAHGGAVVDAIHRQVLFNDESGEESFHVCFGYEPDEQAAEIQLQSIRPFSKQRTMESFCKEHPVTGLFDFSCLQTSDVCSVLFFF